LTGPKTENGCGSGRKVNDGIGQQQGDYYLVNPATLKLSTVASAYAERR
jgi:hypothetical protein